MPPVRARRAPRDHGGAIDAVDFGRRGAATAVAILVVEGRMLRVMEEARRETRAADHIAMG